MALDPDFAKPSVYRQLIASLALISPDLMTQEQALAVCQKLLPAKAPFLTLERQHSIGLAWGAMDEFYVWDHSNRQSEILARSETSWAHAVALVRAKAELYAQDQSSVEGGAR